MQLKELLKKRKVKLKLGFDPKLFTDLSLKLNFRDSCELIPINKNISERKNFIFLFISFFIFYEDKKKPRKIWAFINFLGLDWLH